MNQSSLPETIRVLPVVVIRNPEDTIPTLQALEEGGIPAAEITFRTPCAAEAIRLGVRHFPRMYIGAGTVINAAQAQQALEAGAAFLVSPGLSAEVAEIARQAGVLYLPGCATPTEIMQAIGLGITTVKFFPANVYGGLAAIKAYDVWQEKNMYGRKTMGVVRTTYLIDEQGVIARAFGKVKAGENPQQMLDCL